MTNKRSSAHKSKNNNKSKQNSNVYLIPIILIVSVLPLIVRVHDYTTPLYEYPWFSTIREYTDVFLYYKQLFFVITSVIMIILLSISYYQKKISIKFSSIFIPLVIYAILALLSSILSEYRIYSFIGMFQQFETIFVILGYCLVVYYTYLFVQTEQDVRIILNSILISVLILSVIGFTQAIGHDFFSTDFGLKLILPRSYWEYMHETTFTFGERWVYLTLYNPNYVGVYTSLIIPLIIVQFIYNRNLKLIPIYTIATLGMIISLIWSHSAAGIIGATSGLIFALILNYKVFIKYYKITLPIFLLTLIGIFIYNNINDNVLINRFRQVTTLEKSYPALTDIQTNNDSVVVKYNNNTMNIKFITEQNSFSIYDENNLDISYDYFNDNGGIYIINDKRFPGFQLYPILYDDRISFVVLINNREWIFTNQTEDKSYYYINRYGRLDKIITAPSAIFTGYESIATYRGYIWSRTLPLLKNNILLGSGADTFALEFPQRDYVNLYNYGFSEQFLTKPHSLFLQIGVQSGVLSLLCFIIFYGIYFISSIRLYIKGNLNNLFAQTGFSILIGSFSYMVTSISNDSNISVAPVFWVLIGLGIVVNQKAAQLNKLK